MSLAFSSGSIVTFYSWKGGVGRTLALANTAVQLARSGRKVLMIDWDLEAPGLYQYFLHPGELEAKSLCVTPASTPGGLWSLLHSASTRANGIVDPSEWKAALDRITVPPDAPRTGSPFVPTPAPLDLLQAGHESTDYSEQLAAFSWNTFFQERQGGEWLEAIRHQWLDSYDFILINSRTGLTNSGGVCTIQLPDTLVLVFSANDQSFSGGMKVVAAAQRARRDFGRDRGQLIVIPLLSRWSGDEETDIAEKWLQKFDRELPVVTGPWLPKSLTPRLFLERVRVPHVARFSFGEPLPVLTHSLTDPALPGLAFDNLARLIASDMADAGRIIDPAYQQPRIDTSRPDNDDARMALLAADPSALHGELGRIGQTFGPDSGELSSALAAAAKALFHMARYDEAEPLLRRALAIDERRLGIEHPDVAVDLSNLAELLRTTNRLSEAEPLIRRALTIDEARLGPDHPTVAIRLNNLALLLQDTGRLAEAEPLIRRALAIDEVTLGADHPNVATRLNNLATLLQDTGRFAEAEALMRRALGIVEARLGPEHSNMATALSNLATLLQETGRIAEAEPLIRRALAIDEATFGSDHPSVAIRLSNLASLLKTTDRLAEAEPLMHRALKIDEASYGPDHPLVAIRLNNLASLLGATGRSAEAEPLRRRALTIFLMFQRATGRTHPYLDATFKEYRGLLSTLGRDAAEVSTTIDAAKREAGLI